MKVTYAVLSYGKPELLMRCLLSFRKWHPTDPLIVLDNGGPDWEKVKATGEMFGARMERREGNGPLSKMMNLGIELSETEFTCIVTNGVIFTRYLTDQFVKDFEADPKTAIVGGLLFYPDGRIQHGGGYRRWNEKVMGHYGHGKLSHQALLCSIPAYRIYCTGATAAIRKEFWKDHKYDETFMVSCEDTDLCFQAWESGWRVLYDPEISTIHEEGSTRGKSPAEKKIKAPDWDRKEAETTQLFNAKWTDAQLWKMNLELNRLNREMYPELPRAFVRHAGLGDCLLTLPFYDSFHEETGGNAVIITHVPEAFRGCHPKAIATEMDTYAVSDFIEMDLAYERRQDGSITDGYRDAFKEQTGITCSPWLNEEKVYSTPMDLLMVHRLSPHDWRAPYVVIHTKNGGQSFKGHPVEFWMGLIEKIKEMGFVVVTIGDQADHSFGGENIVNLNGRTNLAMIHALLKNAKLFIGIDTGLLHIADGTCPAIGIFTGTTPKKIVSDEVHVVETPAPCKGCHHRRKNPPVTDYSCEFDEGDMRRFMCVYTLNASTVAAKAKEVLLAANPTDVR